MKTNGNTVLLTGGTSGIGLALAQKFQKEGNGVIVTGRDEAKLAEIGSKYSFQTARADMTSLPDLENLARQYPQVNVLVNNAGIQFNYDLADPSRSISLIDDELNTNLVGPLYLIKLFLPQLQAQPSAAVVNVTSGLAFVPKQTAPVYCGSKAGLHIATRALRWQLESTSVKVFEIVSALVDTPMTAGRGSGKITPQALAEEFWRGFGRDNYEIHIAKTKQLLLVQRLLPALADRIMRNGL